MGFFFFFLGGGGVGWGGEGKTSIKENYLRIFLGTYTLSAR